MSFQSRDLAIHLPQRGEGGAIVACQACATTPPPPKPGCNHVSGPQCADQSRCNEGSRPCAASDRSGENGYRVDLALLRQQLRGTLSPEP